MTDVEQIFIDQLWSLLPPGRLFDRRSAPNLGALLRSLADEFARAFGRVDQLLVEQTPRGASELLPEWEHMLGLPDGCTPQPSSADLRRAAVLVRFALAGGHSRAAIERMCAALGFDVVIEQHRVLRVGFRAGDRCWSVAQGWPWVIRVRAPVVTARFFRCGGSAVGDRLASFDHAPLECAFNRAKPAHASALYAYDLAPHPPDYQPWGWYVFPPTLQLEVRFPPFVLEHV